MTLTKNILNFEDLDLQKSITKLKSRSKFLPKNLIASSF
jgi:hypothetical protein